MNENPQKLATDLFVECLKKEGVRYVFGLPGEETLGLLESIRKGGLEFIVTRHEQAAAFMAATCGRLTGKAGVVLATLGPGATNLVTGVAFAELGAMPLVVITGQKPIKKSKQGQFQIINVVQMMQPITKSTRQIVSAELIPSLIRESFRRAEEERPGAVHLELPEDIAAESTNGAALDIVRTRRPSPDPRSVEIACAMIEHAQHPLLLIAAGANRKRIGNQIRALITKTKIPFFTTQMGKGVIDERSELCLGTAALTDNDFVHRAIDRSDMIVAIGHDVTEKPPAIMGYGTRKVIHVNFYPAPIDDVYMPSFELVGDIAHSISGIAKHIKVSSRWDFAFFKNTAAALRAHIEEASKDAAFPIKPGRLVAELRRSIPDDGILTLDNGMYKIWVARNYPAFAHNTVLLDNALATMGAGLSAAIAAKLTHHDKKVVCLTGDGGFMMNSQEVETAIRLNLDITIVIVNDAGYGMIKWKQDAAGLKPFGLDFKNPDFVKYAESYGAKGYRAASVEDFSRILAGCIAMTGVKIIDCPIDYSGNVSAFSEELKERAGRMG